jgi:hypothetical protein
MKITTLNIDMKRLDDEVQDIHRYLSSVNANNGPLGGTKLAYMQGKVNAISHIEAVHGSVTGVWQDWLNQAALRFVAEREKTQA